MVEPVSEAASENATWLEAAKRYGAMLSSVPPLVLERGAGVELFDVDGKSYLDFESGQYCMQTGHGHPRVVERAIEQARMLMQTGSRFTNPWRIQLAEKLAGIAPYAEPKTFFSSTGSEANENAIRLAKWSTGGFEVVALLRGFHGRTLGSFSVSTFGVHSHAGYGPMMGGACAIPAPHPYRCHFRCGECDLRCWEVGKELIDRSTSGHPAAMILEFVLGGGGVIPIPPNYARAVRDFCDERGTFLITDEALTGMGRTGTWFAFEHTGVIPDIVVTSKSLGGGVPLSAITTSAEVADRAASTGFVQAATHEGDPLQCAIGLANFEVIEDENLIDNCIRMGERFGAGLYELRDRYEILGDVRGLGLLWGLEFVRDKASREESVDLTVAVTMECLKRGLIVGGPPPGGGINVIRLAPPLVIDAEEVDRSLEILDAALAAVSGGAR